MPEDSPITETIVPSKSNLLIKIAVGIGVLIVIIGAAFWYLHTKSASLNSAPLVNPHSTAQTGPLEFNGSIYVKGDTLVDQPGSDYASKSYEWVTGNETVDNWTTLITTHELNPTDPAKPLAAANYAQNVAAMLKSAGATLLETSLINTPDAAAAGIDIKNPPYLLVYIFPGAAGASSELDIQRIKNGSNGSVTSFISAKRLSFSSNADLQTYLQSPEYLKEREAVVLAKMPE